MGKKRRRRPNTAKLARLHHRHPCFGAAYSLSWRIPKVRKLYIPFDASAFMMPPGTPREPNPGSRS